MPSRQDDDDNNNENDDDDNEVPSDLEYKEQGLLLQEIQRLRQQQQQRPPPPVADTTTTTTIRIPSELDYKDQGRNLSEFVVSPATTPFGLHEEGNIRTTRRQQQDYDIPSDIDYKDQGLTLQELLRGRPNNVSSRRRLDTVQRQGHLPEDQRNNNDTLLDAPMMMDLPSTLSYKDQGRDLQDIIVTREEEDHYENDSSSSARVDVDVPSNIDYKDQGRDLVSLLQQQQQQGLSTRSRAVLSASMPAARRTERHQQDYAIAHAVLISEEDLEEEEAGSSSSATASRRRHHDATTTSEANSEAAPNKPWYKTRTWLLLVIIFVLAVVLTSVVTATVVGGSSGNNDDDTGGGGGDNSRVDVDVAPTKEPSQTPPTSESNPDDVTEEIVPTRSPSSSPSSSPTIPRPTSHPTFTPTHLPTTSSPTIIPTAAPTRIWNQLGQDLRGEGRYDEGFGSSVALSENGRILAVAGGGFEGAYLINRPVRVYSFNNETDRWEPFGQLLDAVDENPIHVSLSADGRVLAVASWRYLSNDDDTIESHLRVFRFDQASSQWSQLGQTLRPINLSDDIAMYLSLDGLTVAVSQDSEAQGLSVVRSFRYNEITSNWTQLGQDITLEGNFAMSSDGRTMVLVLRSSFFAFGYNKGTARWESLGQELSVTLGREESFGLSYAVSPTGRVFGVVSTVFDDMLGEREVANIFSYNETSAIWEPLGLPIEAVAYSPMSFSGNGLTIAVGLWLDSNVRVLEYDENAVSWRPIGLDLSGPYAWSTYGYALAISLDGSTVAAGAPGDSTNSTFDGSVRVYAR